MIKKYALMLSLLALATGCGEDRSTHGTLSNRITSIQGSGHRGSGNILFDVITRTNTLKDIHGNFLNYGHYSMFVQAKEDTKERRPVPGLQDARYYLYENNNKKEIEEAKIYVTPNKKNAKNKILLLLDFSGSIVSDCSEVEALFPLSEHDKMQLSENSCYTLVSSAQKFIQETVSDSQLMAIYYFNSQTRIFPLATSNMASAIEDKELLTRSLEKLYNKDFRENYLTGYESTNLYGAVIESTKVACSWVNNCNYDIYKPKETPNSSEFYFASIIVFTDGKDLAKRVHKDSMENFIGRHKDINYYTVGLGDEIDAKVLNEIGKDGFFKADKKDDLEVEFQNLGRELSDWERSFYRIDYCPAQQEGKVDIKIDFDDGRYHGSVLDRVLLPDNINFRCDLPNQVY